MELLQALGQQLLFFDGGMGTLLQGAGLPMGALPESWNLEQPDIVRGFHRQYLDAGCNILCTNSFGANRLKLAGSGMEVKAVVSRAVSLAREAVEQSGRQDAWVALDLGPTGKLLQPLGDLAFEDAVSLYAEMIRAGADGADLILIETMGDLYETKAAVLAAKETCDLPIFVSLVFDETGKLLTGGDIPAAVALLEGLGVTALGFNCGLGPEQMALLLPTLQEYCSLPLFLNPNAGLPVVVDGKTAFRLGPEEFAASCKALLGPGVLALGGCCGTTPAHMAELKRLYGACPVSAPVPKRRRVISSRDRAVYLDRAPVIIGERINPTGKARMKEALRAGDLDHLCREGLRQEEVGAEILDVNVGLPDIDEAAVLEQAVLRLQAVLGTPLQLDSADPAALERAMRVYSGKPLVNSVSGKQSSMDAVFPLLKKYGGMAVALCLDDEGIPETTEGRVAVARRILKEAERYGIGPESFLVDPLTMTVSTGQDNAKITLAALEQLREMGLGTVLGVSNVSFGLPKREQINTAFFTLALGRGLSAGIINPLSAPMRDAYYAFCALDGLDPQCSRYIQACGDAPAAAPAPQAAMSLQDAVVGGLRDAARDAAKKALEQTAPMDLIQQELIPALDRVGKGFEEGRLFLPQLLMGADAAKAAFEVLREQLASQGGAQEPKGTIVLATVKGDIHDIGKNIVKVLLENYGYRVVDLGKDVTPEAVLEAARQEQAPLVGLSALMTTTVPSMEETIALLRRELPECKIMVGGAVLTQEYADQIGADSYSKDAMGSVHYADQLFDSL